MNMAGADRAVYWQGSGVESRSRMTARICRAGRAGSKWPNRSQFLCVESFRIVRTRLRHASSEKSMFSGSPAA
jgi:hypothetical protein